MDFNIVDIFQSLAVIMLFDTQVVPPLVRESLYGLALAILTQFLQVWVIFSLSAVTGSSKFLHASPTLDQN